MANFDPKLHDMPFVKSDYLPNDSQCGDDSYSSRNINIYLEKQNNEIDVDVDGGFSQSMNKIREEQMRNMWTTYHDQVMKI